jgi:poly-beta-hydroxybutyrate-responsive repressor
LLLLLKSTDAGHGYELTETLAPFGLEGVDSSLVYRALREMEEAAWVKSTWDDEETGGPARRVYQITPEGSRYLTAWVDDLREIDRMLHHFLETYDRHLEQSDEDYPKA